MNLMKRISPIVLGSSLLLCSFLILACPTKKPEATQGTDQSTEQTVNADDLQKEADAIMKEIDGL